MKNKRLLLLGTILKATGKSNVAKYSDDKKKRSAAKGALAGKIILIVMLAALAALISYLFCMAGLKQAVPTATALIISLLAFFLTIFETNGYLFNFKEYDMLMALPFEVRTIVSVRFLYMYLRSLPWYACMSWAMLLGCILAGETGVLSAILWFVLSLFLPLLPMVLASALGILITAVGVGFRHKKAVQTVLIFVLIIPLFFLRFVIEALIRDDEALDSTLSTASDLLSSVGKWLFTAKWFDTAVNESNILYAVLLIAVSVVVFEVFFIIVARNYRRINSALAASGVRKKAKAATVKKKSMITSIAFKEFKRFTGSTTYITNVGIGHILALMIALISLFLTPEKLLSLLMQDAPIEYARLQPIIPFCVYFLIGMMSTTCCSPSLEGRNFWIIKSLPVDMTAVTKGKMLFNMWLDVPFATVSTLLLCISARVGIIDTILSLILINVLCALSTCFGMVCGIKHMRLDWENEIEVIKQGAASASYIIPQMILTSIVVTGVGFLSYLTQTKLILPIAIVIGAALTVLAYLRAMSLTRKRM